MYPVGGISASIYANRLRSEGMGSKDQAVLFASQDYEALKQQCVESGCLFEDPCFPTEPPSLGFKELAPYSSKTRDVEWMRPTVGKLRGEVKAVLGISFMLRLEKLEMCVFTRTFTDYRPTALCKGREPLFFIFCFHIRT